MILYIILILVIVIIFILKRVNNKAEKKDNSTIEDFLPALIGPVTLALGMGGTLGAGVLTALGISALTALSSTDPNKMKDNLYKNKSRKHVNKNWESQKDGEWLSGPKLKHDWYWYDSVYHIPQINEKIINGNDYIGPIEKEGRCLNFKGDFGDCNLGNDLNNRNETIFVYSDKDKKLSNLQNLKCLTYFNREDYAGLQDCVDSNHVQFNDQKFTYNHGNNTLHVNGVPVKKRGGKLVKDTASTKPFKSGDYIGKIQDIKSAECYNMNHGDYGSHGSFGGCIDNNISNYYYNKDTGRIQNLSNTQKCLAYKPEAGVFNWDCLDGDPPQKFELKNTDITYNKSRTFQIKTNDGNCLKKEGNKLIPVNCNDKDALFYGSI